MKELYSMPILYLQADILMSVNYFISDMKVYVIITRHFWR